MPTEEIILLPAGTKIKANESVESAKLIQSILDYAIESDGCLNHDLIPASFEILANPKGRAGEPHFITLDLQITSLDGR